MAIYQKWEKQTNKQQKDKKKTAIMGLWEFVCHQGSAKTRRSNQKKPPNYFLLVLTPFEKQIPLKNKLLQVNNYEKVSHFIKKIDKLLLTVLTN